jgi:peptidase E
MNVPLKPIYLFANSSLLFWQSGLLLEALRDMIDAESPKAAYIGASNDDDPNFYSIFELVMDQMGIRQRRMIRKSFSAEDASFVAEADLILLAGGDVQKGWQVFERSGMREAIIERYYAGGLLMGVSAGAVQLGLLGWPDGELSPDALFPTLKLVPFLIDVHDEEQEWSRLKQVLKMTGDQRGIGIQAGGGMIYYADGSIEPIRFPAHEFSNASGRLSEHLLFPNSGGSVIEASEVC